MTACLNDPDWELFEAISETFALPDSPRYMDPEAFNRFVRSRIPPRGKRFANDHRDTCAYIARSKNANVVAYTANFVVPAGSAEAAKAFTASDDPAFERDRLLDAGHYHGTHTQNRHHLPTGTVPVPSGRGIACAINGANAAHAYFVRLEPSYIAARRKKGITTDCDELGVMERRLAYGYKTKCLDVDEHVGRQLAAHVKPSGTLARAMAASARGSSGQTGEAQDGWQGSGAVGERLLEWWRRLPSLVMSFAPLPAWPAVAFTLPPLAAASSPHTSSGAEVDHPSWLHDEDTTTVLIATIAGELCVLEKVLVKSVEHWYGLPSVDYIEVFGVALKDGTWKQEKQLNNGRYETPKDVTPEDVAGA